MFKLRSTIRLLSRPFHLAATWRRQERAGISREPGIMESLQTRWGQVSRRGWWTVPSTQTGQAG